MTYLIRFDGDEEHVLTTVGAESMSLLSRLKDLMEEAFFEDSSSSDSNSSDSDKDKEKGSFSGMSMSSMSTSFKKNYSEFGHRIQDISKVFSKNK